MSFGRPVSYPLRGMDVGEEVQMEANTAADVKRIARNVSQYGTRHDRGFTCRLDKTATPPVMHVTRLR